MCIARNQGEEADIDVMIKDLEEKFANKKKVNYFRN